MTANSDPAQSDGDARAPGVVPFYVATPHGQLRLWRVGEGPPAVVLPGLINAAASVARRLALAGPGVDAVVIELPGIGGSASVPPDVAAAAIGSALATLGLARAPLLALDLCAPIAAALAPARPHGPLPILLQATAARGWAAHGCTPPPLAPLPDGTHLTALFAFLRDRHVLDPAAPWRASGDGDPLPDAQALNDTVVAAGWRPEAFAGLWSACLDGMAALPMQPEAATWADALRQLRASPATGAMQARGRGPLDYVATPGGWMHIRRAGPAGHRPVIALHSAPGSAAPLAALIEGLATDRDVIAPDYLGNGESDKPGGSVDIAGLARDVLALADALGLPRFDLWGTHTGALIALETGLLAPDRVGRAILEGPPLLPPALNSDILQYYFPPLDQHPWGLHLQQAWNMRRDMFLFWPWYRAERSAARPLGIPDAAFLHDWTIGLLQSGRSYDRSYRAAFEYDTRARLPHLACPSLICAGEADMLAGSLATARDMALPRVTVTATPATVWYPKQSAEAVDATIATYRGFLDAA
jgi:pimeloyl-ACP methyl ester carboxylesterase